MGLFIVLVAILITTVVIALIKYHRGRRDIYEFASKLPGALTLPIIGNGYLFACKYDEIFNRMQKLITSHNHPMKLWLGPKLIVIFTKLSHVEKIMSSTKITHKSDVYRFMGDFIGSGLITASGSQWKDDRKLIMPLFNLKFVTSNLHIVSKHVDVLLKNMENLVGVGYIDSHDVIKHCCFDITGELIFGQDIGTQRGSNLHIIADIEYYYSMVFSRMIKPWLQPDFLFNLTSYKASRDAIIESTSNFAYVAMDEAVERLKNKQRDISEAAIADQLINLLQETNREMSRKDLKDHLLTLYGASEDTLSMAVNAVCYALGMYPEYQEKAVQEIIDVLGDNKDDITIDDIAKLNYLEMCIKEALRLAPVAPFILRQSTEVVQVEKYKIPPGCDVMIPIFNLHRNPEQWEHAEEYYPDHFLPEAVKQRNLYSYIPFSIGPRNCIGKFLAMQSIKLILSKVLRMYKFSAKGKFSDVKFKTDISVRPINGYMVKIERRKLD